MNKTLRLLTTATLALLLAACTAETDADALTGGETTPDGKMINVSLTLTPEVPLEVTTREPDVPVDENIIKDIYIVQFDDAGKLLTHAYIDNLNSNIATYTGQLKNTPGKIYVVANSHMGLGYWEQTGFGGGAISEQSLLAQTVPDAALYPGGTIIMSGVHIGKPAPKINIPLQRIIAKVAHNITTSLPTGHSFTLTSVQMKNLPKYIYYVRDNPDAIPFPVLTAAFDDLMDGDSPAPDFFMSYDLSDWWYLPENCRGTGTATSELQKNAETAPAGQAQFCTYMEIKGKYSSGNWVGALDVTYRIYLGRNNTNDYNLKRNTNYTVNITIKGANRADTRITVTGTENAATYLDYTDNNCSWLAVGTADASSSTTYATWMTGTGSGADGSLCPAGWRMPTIEELALMYVYNINATNSYYISSNVFPLDFTNGTTGFGEATTIPGCVRCVRDF